MSAVLIFFLSAINITLYENCELGCKITKKAAHYNMFIRIFFRAIKINNVYQVDGVYALFLFGIFLFIYSFVARKVVPLHPNYNALTFMNRKLLLTALIAVTYITVKAGGLMTNTNYHIAFDRMMARGASFDIDAAYSNPAGLAWGHEGWQLSLNFQKPWQNRDIELNIPPSDFTSSKVGVYLK